MIKRIPSSIVVVVSMPLVVVMLLSSVMKTNIIAAENGSKRQLMNRATNVPVIVYCHLTQSDHLVGCGL